MNAIEKPTILVIIGISGDLSQRYLLPAIRSIAEAHVLPESFRVVGITRRSDLKLEDVLSEGDNGFLEKHVELYQMNLAAPHDYQALTEHLQAIETEFGAPAQRLFYLSVPPQVSQPIISNLGNSGLNKVPDTKLLLEKPFGVDRSSAEDLIDHLMQHFSEDQIYRIDHYMAKEMAQNILAFRHSNPLFRCTWSNEFIEYIEVLALESIDIEGRSGFYEQTGALRDFVQSHLLQLAALTLMDISDPLPAVPERRLQALQSLLPPMDVAASTIRGQYQGYRDQVNNSDSVVETYASITLSSKDPLWKNVPITLITGKAMQQRSTEIRVHYRRKMDTELGNTLVLRVQPDEGISLSLWIKEPGYSQEVKQLPLEFSYDKHFKNALPSAYERVFVDAMRSDHSLFTTSAEVLESWRILEPIQHAWSMNDENLIIYPVGASLDDITSGSAEAS
jgi:glucose-6-phosphate 1-dehydrogenase